MAWEKGSSIYNSLVVAKPGLLALINQLGLLAEPMPSLDTIAMHHNLTSGSLQLSSIPHKIEATSDNNTAAPTSPQRHAAPAVVSSSSTEIVVVRALVLVLFDASFPEWPLRDTSTSDVLDDVKRSLLTGLANI
ncbi:hypothetical protein KI387_003597 [Taxus chinensis]|uniref:Uncharacterized protein n=1 Tax=Taxus chinensis TaxID=29808 RepID=A0AA38LPV5_TAXCH|nr:hypothetical protein KI387_003597 [Taxus chinensis]